MPKFWWKYRLQALKKREARRQESVDFFVRRMDECMHSSAFHEAEYRKLEACYRTVAVDWLAAKRKCEKVEAKLNGGANSLASTA